MKLTIAVFGPMSVQRKMEHRISSFKNCITQTAEDIVLLVKQIDPERQKEWEKVEILIER
jgi:hypothetical protein